MRPREVKTLAQVTPSREVAQQSPSPFPSLRKAIWGQGCSPRRESCQSAGSSSPPPSHAPHTGVSHGPGKEQSLRGRLPWEAVQGALGAAPCGWWRGRCTCSGACTCSRSHALTLSLSLWFLHFLCSSSRGVSAAGSAPPDWGLTERNLQGQKWQGTLEISQASRQLSSVRSRTLDVRTGAAWGEVRVLLSTYIEHIC